MYTSAVGVGVVILLLRSSWSWPAAPWPCGTAAATWSWTSGWRTWVEKYHSRYIRLILLSIIIILCMLYYSMMIWYYVRHNISNWVKDLEPASQTTSQIISQTRNGEKKGAAKQHVRHQASTGQAPRRSQTTYQTIYNIILLCMLYYHIVLYNRYYFIIW